MKQYQVTLTKSVRVNGKRQTPGTVVEVNEKTLAELKYHAAVGHVEPVATDVQTNDANAQDFYLLTELPDFKKIKVDEIKAQLAARNIPFDVADDKTELYTLLQTAIENERAADDTTQVGE